MGSRVRADTLVKLFARIRSKPKTAPASTRFSSRKFGVHIQVRIRQFKSASRSGLAGRWLTSETYTIPRIAPEKADRAPLARCSQSAGYVAPSRCHLIARDGGSISNIYT